VLVICIFASANSFAADLLPLTKDGFGGIKWGSEYSDKLGMKECDDYGKVIICTKSDESLKEIAGVPVDVVYIFKGTIFHHIRISFKGAQHWLTITKSLTNAYGKSRYDTDERVRNGFAYSNIINGIGIGGGYTVGKQILFVESLPPIGIEEIATNRFNKMALSIFTDAERNSLEGFLGAKWGMTVKQIPQKIIMVMSSDNWETYLQIENLYFGSIPVSSISYLFTDGKLGTINIDFELTYTLEDPLILLKDILELNFGKFKEYKSGYILYLPKTIISIDRTDIGVRISAFKY
ncbi:MAG: hypothetical protein LBV04_07795, partial [Deferribacteraceae bacterium]|nr:hypothetical protein [Deferribacteraceae bacterium]